MPSKKVFDLAQNNFLFRTFIWKNWLRFRKATSPFRMLPSFYILGCRRCGTTSLYLNLIKHPLILSAFVKEVPLNKFEAGSREYRQYFPFRRFASGTETPVPITGDGQVGMLYYPELGNKMKAFLPDIKLIVMLRNPINRAYSHYKMNCQKQREPLSFEQALAQEEERTRLDFERKASDKGEVLHKKFDLFAYRAQGEYHKYLREWMQIFSNDQILVIKSEDYYQNSEKVYEKVIRFLGLPIWLPEEVEPTWRTGEKSLSPEIKSQLQAHYKPHNKELYQLLGTDFNWE